MLHFKSLIFFFNDTATTEIYTLSLHDALPISFADFIFQGSMNKEGKDDIDLKHFYRQIPEGESTWERDYTKGTITFTAKDGRQTTGSFIGSGEVSCGDGKSFNVENNAFQFALNGKDDWTNIYSDYDKFAKKPRLYWISVTKKK